MKYVVVDIGCLECCNDSKLIGIYDSKEKAEEIAKKESTQDHSFYEPKVAEHQLRIFEYKEK